MRLELAPGGLVDDFVIENVVVEITRVGDARYVLRAQGTAIVVVNLWTTRKDRVLAEPQDDRPCWAQLEVGERGELVSLHATDCHLHLEHLDRNAYFLRVSRGPVGWGLTLRSHGYIATSVDPSSTDAA